MRYSHIIQSRLLGSPLAILPEKLRTICDVLEIHLPGERLAFDPALSRQRAQLHVVEGVALIDVYGTMIHRPLGLGMEALSGLVTYEDIRADLRQALSRQDVDAILFDFDTPGGEAAGCFDLADDIFAARAEKRIVGIANDMACSGGIALLAACGEAYVTQSATTGSVGVRSIFRDQSKADDAAGFVYYEIYSGAHKIDGSPHGPLTDQARQAFQNRSDEMRDLFVAAIARYRGIDPSVVRATEAATFLGGKAVAAGLADGVRTYDELLSELINPREEPLIVADKTTNMTDPQMVEHLRANQPEVISLIRREEATRLDGIRSATLPGHEKLVQQMMAKNADLQPGDVALAIVQAEKTKLANKATILDIEEHQLEQVRTQLTEGDPAPSPVMRPPTPVTFEQKVESAWNTGKFSGEDGFDSKEKLAAYASAHPEILEGVK